MNYHQPAKQRYFSQRARIQLSRRGETVMERLNRRLWTVRGIWAWPFRHVGNGCFMISPWSPYQQWNIFINAGGVMRRLRDRTTTFADWSRRFA